jgi:hypothetical protein
MTRESESARPGDAKPDSTGDLILQGLATIVAAFAVFLVLPTLAALAVGIPAALVLIVVLYAPSWVWPLALLALVLWLVGLAVFRVFGELWRLQLRFRRRS